MSAKVQKNYEGAIPQWLTDGGVEVFSHNGKTYLMIDNARVAFDDAPAEYREFFEEMFLADKQGRHYLKAVLGITSQAEGFDRWMFCKFGGIDKASDLIDGRLVPDVYNNVCTDRNCPLRGKFCGSSSNLTSIDVQTVKVLSEGKTIENVALKLFLSIPGAKSRINALKEKTGAANMAQLMTITARLGAI